MPCRTVGYSWLSFHLPSTFLSRKIIIPSGVIGSSLVLRTGPVVTLFVSRSLGEALLNAIRVLSMPCLTGDPGDLRVLRVAHGLGVQRIRPGPKPKKSLFSFLALLFLSASLYG